MSLLDQAREAPLSWTITGDEAADAVRTCRMPKEARDALVELADAVIEMEDAQIATSVHDERLRAALERLRA